MRAVRSLQSIKILICRKKRNPVSLAKIAHGRVNDRLVIRNDTEITRCRRCCYKKSRLISFETLLCKWSLRYADTPLHNVFVRNKYTFLIFNECLL